MIRSQVYLTEEERVELKLLSQTTGRTQSDLIREAVDLFIKQSKKSTRLKRFSNAFGLWMNHDNYPDIRKLRNELDRKL